MRDDCNCRSHPEMADLSGEHDLLEELLDALGAAVSRGDATAADRIIHDLRHVLEPPAAPEGHRVLLGLRQPIETSAVDALAEEHAEIARLLTMVDGPRWRVGAAALIALLGAHLHREQGDPIPAAHRTPHPDWRDAPSPHPAGV